MDLTEAQEWSESLGVAIADQQRFLLTAGLAAGLSDPTIPLVSSLDPVVGASGYAVAPIRLWRDPRNSGRPAVLPDQDQGPIIPGDGVRISFEPGTGPDLMAFLQDSLQPLTHPIVFSYTQPRSGPLRPWSVPIRVGIDRDLRDLLIQQAPDWIEPLTTLVDPFRRRSNPQLLIGNPTWIADWAERTTNVAGAVIVVGAGPPNPIDELLGSGRAGAWIQLPEILDVVESAAGILYFLSHNRSLDEAVALMAEDRAMVINADPAYLDRTRITDAIELASDRQARSVQVDQVDWSDGRTRRSDPDPHRSAAAMPDGLPDVVADILDDFRGRPFEHETHDATDAANRIRDIEDRTSGREHRFLTAEVEARPLDLASHDQGDGAEGETPESAAALDVWVAPLRLAGPAVAPERLPEGSFDWSAGDVELDVVLFELRDNGLARRETISLPITGASSRARFDLAWSAGDFEARVAVLHKHRFVQTMLLTVGDGGASLTFEAECIVRAADFELNDLEPHNAAIILNDHDGPKVALSTSSGAAIRSPEGLDELRQSMTNLLLRIIDDPEEFESINSQAFSDLLCDLALRGSTLRDVLFTGSVTAVAPEMYDDLRSAERISVLSAEPTKVLPLEFVYDPDFNPPFGEKGSVCGSAVLALQSGQDLAELLPDCAHTTDSGTCGADETKMCPLGFWGFRTVIERHARRPDSGPVEMGFTLAASPTAERPSLNVSNVLASATPKADANPDEAWSAAKAEMSTLLAGRFETVDGWHPIVDDFKDEATTRDVLLLLPHVDKDDDGQLLLDLGVEPSMGVHQITRALELKSDQPLVLLLGCATGPSDTPTIEFPGRFLDAGAAAVLATMTLVRGRFVSVLGRQLIGLISEMAGASDEPLFGEALLKLRQKLLASNPLVLTLIAYGDADWVLASEDV